MFGDFPEFLLYFPSSGGVQKPCHLANLNGIRRMTRLLEPLWLLLAAATDRKLTRMVEYLQAENKILRSKLPRVIQVTPGERRRLLRLGQKLGSAIQHLITIVHPRTFARWLQEDQALARERRCRQMKRKPGRPMTAQQSRKLVLRIADATGWGYTRILGELKKLRVRLSRSTVKNILIAAGYDPGPDRSPGSWTDFVKRHAATLWASDFITARTWTTRGVIDVYILFFIHIGTRRVYVSGVSSQPDANWVAQQARNFCMTSEEWDLPAKMLIIDHDSKYSKGFDAVLEAEGIEVKRVGPRAPNMNAYAERWVQSLRNECLDFFLILGEKHLWHIVKEYEAYYNEERPHQGIGNKPILGEETEPDDVLPFPSKVQCHERLGGLLKSYSRAA